MNEDALVEISVYDILGRQVAVIESGWKVKGRYDAVWNGTGTDGNEQPAGVYIIRMKAGSYVNMIKAVLAR